MRENWEGEITAVHFSWQRIDSTGADVGLPMPIGDGVRTPNKPSGWPGDGEWTYDWDTALFPDGPGYVIAVVENCAGATTSTPLNAASRISVRCTSTT